MPVSALAPAMSRASLTTTPSKPSSSRSTPITLRENVAGRCGSIDETTMWEVMTDATPASTAARKGASSRSWSTSRVTSTRGSPWCESTTVSPWPGKCFAQAATPVDCRPSTQAAVWRATRAGSSPKLRTPMTGLSGEELTSTSGARSSPMPSAVSS